MRWYSRIGIRPSVFGVRSLPRRLETGRVTTGVAAIGSAVVGDGGAAIGATATVVSVVARGVSERQAATLASASAAMMVLLRGHIRAAVSRRIGHRRRATS